jgi:hypothetical protein
MVAMNSMPQQDVAKGRGQREFFRASPITLSKEVVKYPSPVDPSGASTIFTFVLNLTGRPILL